ncbi:MAG: RagB/SusD family nutrient uptake outer membrane protein [Bacteroidota bacterium]|nr:RagB/SusD family nutrient uptake outer membrane protein [Bacteroidota bacterium]
MIQKAKYLILLLFAVMLTTSCNKWLELKPQDGIIRQNFWKTKEDVKAVVVGIYSSMLGNLSQTLFTWGEIRGDMVTSTLKTSTDQLNIMNDNITSSNSVTSWANVYQIINYCNTVIAFAPQVLNTDKTFTQTALNGYLAEAYGIRALMYFYLMRTFGEVPLQLTATSSDASIKMLPKSSQTDVYNQIVSDLTFAENNAVLTYNDNNQDKGRITKYTVNAIQADVYLWMEKYTDCITACDKVINSGKFGLIEGKRDDGSFNTQWFNTVFYTGNSNESIFEFQFDNQKTNPFYSFLINSSTNQFVGSSFVMDEFYTVDPIDDKNKDIRADLGSIRASDGLIWKYAGASNSDPKAVRNSTSSYAHWFVYRYADILLMKAEALACTSQGQAALDLVKVIRNRANALQATEKAPDPTSAVDVCDYIMDERAREFAFEGKRWFDILRNAKRNNYAHLQYLLDIITKIAPPALQQSMVSKYSDVRSHYLPINLYELQTDSKLIQNPFYQ